MVDRPLENVRPLGPFIGQDDTDSSTAEDDDVDPIAQTAEDWYKSINKEENKRKMMRNYLKSITDLSESEIDQKLDEADL